MNRRKDGMRGRGGKKKKKEEASVGPF